MRIHFFFTVLLGMTFTILCEARTLSLKDTGPAGFFRITGGKQVSGDNFYANSSGSNTFFTEDVDLNLGGELGFVFSFNEKFAVRIGAEFVQTKDATVTGKSSTDVPLMTVDNANFAFNPNLAFEFGLQNTGGIKTILLLGAGYATMTVKNEYALNTDGQAEYSLPAAFKETVRGNGFFLQGAVGFEFVTVDNVSTLLELGYRELKVDELEYTAGITTFNGTYAEGARALNNDGSNRSAKIAGPYIGLSFRFRFPAFL